jgi:hypothetical protein
VARDASEESGPKPETVNRDPLEEILKLVAANPQADETCRAWAGRLLKDDDAPVTSPTGEVKN